MSEDWSKINPPKKEVPAAAKQNYLPRVLVVDDNPRLIPVLKRTLETGGFQAIFCTNGQQAWDYLLLNADVIDVLVTDVHMPIVSGLELIQRIMQTGWEIPIIVLTAQTQNQELLRLEGVGVHAILTKPHGVKELPDRLSSILERKGKLHAKRTGPAFEPDVPTILMVEDDPVFSLVIGNAIKKNVSGRMLSCGTVQQARYLMESCPLALLICDLNLPDGNSLGLISSLLDLQPETQVVLITASRAPLLKHRAEALGFMRFLEKPIQPMELSELAESLLHPKKARPMNSTTTHLSRFTNGLDNRNQIEPLLDLRRRCQMRETGNLIYINGGQEGSVILDFGKIMHAACNSLFGMEALGLIMSWDSASVELTQSPDPAPITMPRRTWQSLLVEAFQYDARFSQLPPNQVGAHRWKQKK